MIDKAKLFRIILRSNILCHNFLLRDHSSITSSKRWVGEVRKWQKHDDVILEWSLTQGNKTGPNWPVVLRRLVHALETWNYPVEYSMAFSDLYYYLR